MSHPISADVTHGIGISGGIRRDVAVVVAGDDVSAAGHREIDRRQPVLDIGHVLVDLVPQPEVDREVIARAPVVLGVHVEPGRSRILAPASTDSGASRHRISEQEVGQGVTAELPRVRERPARRVRVLRSEPQIKQVPAELDSVCAAIDQEVVVQLEVLVLADHEGRRVTHVAVETDRADLRESRVARIDRDTAQPHPLGEVVARVQTALASVHAHPPKAELVQHVGAERLRVAHPEIASRRVEGSTEPGDQ